ncbi:DegS sensor signal transduction histidine kinase [Thermaerobacter marianensis DSM 12885]|uniref:histidine kinase n=1 Tax=Thermaerobacter marianensis (strain ATCC 700841 / DSM 12885 / JCM 10246 / 7p75a) TaxID=644966 RepID=E6SL97_THEM7|nr:DegS sensor signal transduction histidine kinase [Thermaerobacter marianensis DSM 12885]
MASVEAAEASIPGPLDPVTLDRVLRETLAAVERGREQVFFIAEQAREEYREAARELDEVRAQVQALIQQVDDLARRQQGARLRLVEISRHFHRYGEEAYREAYEEAMRLHEQWVRAQEREAQLRQRRDELERRLRRLGATVQRAEELAGNIRLALELLSGKLGQLLGQAADLQRRLQVGLMLLKAQEEERRRLARDIHDGPAQMLANVVLRVEVCQRLLDEDVARAREELERLKALTRESLQDVRKIIFDLRPMALDDLGLLPALRQYVAGFIEKTGLPVELVSRGSARRLDPAVEITVYRVLQEALNNVWKHAGASRVVLRVEFAAQRLWAEVADDGCGFDPAAPRGTDRFGLANMQERVAMVGGRLEIRSRPGHGTRVRLEIPLGREEAGHADPGPDR